MRKTFDTAWHVEDEDEDLEEEEIEEEDAEDGDFDEEDSEEDEDQDEEDSAGWRVTEPLPARPLRAAGQP